MSVMHKTHRDRLVNTAQQMAKQMPSVDPNSQQPLNTITLYDLDWIISYLNDVKRKRFGTRTQTTTKDQRQRDKPMSQPVPRDRPTDIRSPRNPDWIDPFAHERRPQPQQHQLHPQQQFRPRQEYGRHPDSVREMSRYVDPRTEFTRSTVNPRETKKRSGDPIDLFSRQLDSFIPPAYRNPYETDYHQEVMSIAPRPTDMGDFPRDLGIESRLTRQPTVRATAKWRDDEVDRFEQLPHNPQEEQYTIWERPSHGGLPVPPRGGYLARDSRR
jgi:hypothetical protein